MLFDPTKILLATSIWSQVQTQVHCTSTSTRGASKVQVLQSEVQVLTSSSAVAKGPRDASYLSVVSFDSTKRRVVFYC